MLPRVLAWLLPLAIVPAACGSDVVVTSPSTSAPGDTTTSSSTEPPSLAFDDGVQELTTSAADPEATVAAVEEESTTSSGDSPSATDFDFDQLHETVAATCEPTAFYGVHAFTGIDDLWYHVDAQWIELSSGLMFTNYVTVNDGTGTEVAVEEIPTELLVARATWSAQTCFDESNDWASFDYEDPGLYDPYDIVPRGGQSRPPWPGG